MAISSAAGPRSMPPGVLQPFAVRFRRDDLHVMAFFEGHPSYEAVEAMIRYEADGRYSIRAIITRHDQSQIDHINDDGLFAAFGGTARERHRRDIDLRLEPSDAGRRARLEFVSMKDEHIVLDLVTVGQPDVKRGGLTDPGRHSASSSLPLMWRGATTLADPRTSVTIDGVAYSVPVKVRAGTFVAHEGYYTEGHSMGVVRAGTVDLQLLRAPDRIDVGAEWIYREGESETVYRVAALGADGMLRIAKLDDSGEIVTGHMVGDRFEVTYVALRAEADAADRLALAFDRNAGFSVSIEGQQDILCGRVHTIEEADGLSISLSPAQPLWATHRTLRIRCSGVGDRLRFVTTIGEG
jgi:hypothetical protein